jgi:hypothetical protein
MPPDTLQAPGEAAARGVPTTYAQFWTRYLEAHSDRRSRALHYLGTGGAIVLLVSGAITRDWRVLIAAPLFGYGLAWLGHAVFEHNRPETFSHPVWSLVSDLRMLGLFLTGRIGADLRRRQIGRS